jgi:hypothetical protein
MREKIKLVSTTGSGYYYITTKNSVHARSTGHIPAEARWTFFIRGR